MDNICHDPGYKLTKDCQEYVCRNGLNGFELVKEGNKLLTLSKSFDDDIILTKPYYSLYLDHILSVY